MGEKECSEKVVGPRVIVGCPNCGFGKSSRTHTYGVYRVYKCFGRIVLRCKTCNYELVFRVIGGG